MARISTGLVGPGRFSLLLVAVALSLGCRKEEIRVYRIPKEKPVVASREAHDPAQALSPRLAWNLPAGWEERGPGQMSVASFWIPGKEGDGAEVSVMPMPGEGAGNLSLVVNIVREGAGLEPIGDEELTKLVEDIKVGDATAKLVDLSGATTSSAEQQTNRIVLAILPRAGRTWFFKMAGSMAVVSAQKGAFLDFLKSIAFREPEARSMPAASSLSAVPPGDARGGRARPKWELPPGWQEVPPTQMLLAKFQLTGEGEARAEVTVSVLAGDGGKLPANVNRWRAQIGLPEVPEAELPKLVGSLDVEGAQAMLVDMNGQDTKTGQKKRLICVILPRGGETWFYKLMGDERIAEQQKEAFLKFVQTARHPNAV